MSRPTFLVLGAPKCGTTTLHHLLGRHPDVFMASTKDPLFFELDAEWREGPGAYWQRYFQGWKGEPAVGEARPTKLMLPFVPERVQACFPDARLIAILRDPAERAFSHWWMRRCNGLEALDLDEALRRNAAAIDDGRTFEGQAGADAWREHLDPAIPTAPVYLEFGDYARQLARWFGRFPRQRVAIVFFDDLAADPEGTLARLFAFLVVDPTGAPAGRSVYNAALPGQVLPPLEADRRLGRLSRVLPAPIRRGLKRRLSGWGAPPRLDPATRRRLVAHYTGDVRALEALTGRDLSAWRSAG